jgi:hypothetical protein
MEAQHLRVITDFESALMRSIVEAEKAKPKPKPEVAAFAAKPKRVGSKTWSYTSTGRNIRSDQ